MLSDDMAVRKDKHLIYSYEVDVRGRAQPSVLADYLLDGAWNHANMSDFSYDKLLEQGQFWVLSKLLVIFNRMPKWNDEVIVETWGKGVDRFFALRDFVIRAYNDEKLVVATSCWLILDRNSYRPRKLDKLLERFPWQFGRNELNVKLEKIQELTKGETTFSQRVRFTDLDVNKHVIASRYMEWILNGYPIKVLEEKELRTFEINFAGEAKLDDEITVCLEPIDKSNSIYLNSIKRRSDNKELCRARVEWS